MWSKCRVTLSRTPQSLKDLLSSKFPSLNLVQYDSNFYLLTGILVLFNKCFFLKSKTDISLSTYRSVKVWWLYSFTYTVIYLLVTVFGV